MDASIEKRPRTRLSPQKRKLQLMEIALEVFAKRGIGRGGHADIAEIAQVSVATVFNYFPTRDEVWPLFVSTNRTNQLLIRNMFMKAMERGELCEKHDVDNMASLFHGIFYSIFLQVNRLGEQEAVYKLADSYLNMLCIYKN